MNFDDTKFYYDTKKKYFKNIFDRDADDPENHELFLKFVLNGTLMDMVDNIEILKDSIDKSNKLKESEE